MSVFVKHTATPCAFTASESWVILSPIEQSIKRKIEAVGTPLKDWGIQINYGIKTGCNEAFIIDEAKRAEILSWCHDANERKRTEQIIRPILRGRDIKRYGYDWAGLYLIATHNGIPEKEIKRIDIKNYPSLKRHLDAHWEKIASRSDMGDTPYNLRSCAYMDDFNKPKIVWADLARTGNAFIYDEAGFTAPNTTYLIASDDTSMLKYLIGLLNSKAMLQYLDWVSAKLDETGWRWFKQYVELFPIPSTSTDAVRIINLVNKVLMLKQANPSADTSSVEREIGLIVYRLYGLTAEEASAIDNRKLYESVK